jgi:hypothetical protein
MVKCDFTVTTERAVEGTGRPRRFRAASRAPSPLSIDTAQISQLRAELGPAAIAKKLGIARSSVYRALGAA